MWEVEGTDEFATWYLTLTFAETARIDATIRLLEEQDPGLGRPRADTLTGSRLPNLKELRPSTSLRILFAFDPRRTAILLLGGDKRD